MFADVSSGDGLVKLAFQVLIIGLCLLIVFALGRWLIQKFAMPPVVLTCWIGLFLIVGAVVVINFLMGLGGHQFLHYW